MKGGNSDSDRAIRVRCLRKSAPRHSKHHKHKHSSFKLESALLPLRCNLEGSSQTCIEVALFSARPDLRSFPYSLLPDRNLWSNNSSANAASAKANHERTDTTHRIIRPLGHRADNVKSSPKPCAWAPPR
jgi:hypothetical protein